jgi:hypothetical protein
VRAVRRPGNAHAARGARGVLERISRPRKQRCPQGQRGVRGESALAVPRRRRLEEWEREWGGSAYGWGVAQNAVLLRQGAAAVAEARARLGATRQPVHHFDAFPSAAESWPQARHVVRKAESTAQGETPRFVVTALAEFAPARLSHA